MQRKRVVGLDLWRGLLLLGGPTTHAAQLVSTFAGGDNIFLSLTREVSHLFRMQAFFFISGLVSTWVLRQKPNWLPYRLIQIGLPFLAMWSLFLLPKALIKHWISGASMDSAMNPQYLWFLPGLIGATLIALMLDRPLTRLAIAINSRNLLQIFFCWCLLSAIFAAATPYLQVITAPHEIMAEYVVGKMYYLCYYFAGVVISQSPQVLNRVRNERWIIYAPGFPILAISIYALSTTGKINIGADAFGRSFFETCSAVSSVAICMFMLHIALRIESINFVFWRLSRASFTVYLFHIQFIGLLAIIPGVRSINSSLAFFLISYLSLSMSLLLHHRLARYAWFRLVFNGRIEGSAKKWIETRVLHYWYNKAKISSTTVN